MLIPSFGTPTPLPQRTKYPRDDVEESISPTTTRTTYISKATSSSTHSDSSGGILAQAEATTNLSWWQLLCIALGGTLLLSMIIWVMWRARRKKTNDKKRAKEIEAEEEKRMKDLVEQRRLQLMRKKRSGRGGGKEDSDSEESYDSVSDGGTIRPKRRKRRDRGRRRRRGRGRGRRDIESESDWSYSDDSDTTMDTYVPRRLRGRRRRDEDYRDRDDRRRYDNRTVRPISPPPLPPVPFTPRRNGSKGEKTFRDSVFSTYHSMKEAAVKLKQVEAKAKLKKQLEEEDALEAARRAKVVEANRAIELERRAEELAGSSQPLIPPVNRSMNESPGNPSIETIPPPPPAFRPAEQRSYSASSRHADPYQAPRRQVSERSVNHPARAARPDSGGLHSEVHRLLGKSPAVRSQNNPLPGAPMRQPSPHSLPPAARRAPTMENDFQASWLAHPAPAISLPQSPRSGSVYLPVTPPKDRPIIPRGGLAPAPPPKAKNKLSDGLSTGFNSAYGGVSKGGNDSPAPRQGGLAGPGAGKWADRLRSRK